VEISAGAELRVEKIRPKVDHPTLRRDLCKWKAASQVLLAWDAPLTGPSNPDCPEAGESHSLRKSDFTKRGIERSFTGAFKPSAGVSIQGYAGCQHWTVTRNLLGLPRVGPYDCEWEELPFRLLHSRPKSWSGHHVVEVHPAVAMWLWLKDAPIGDWRYKHRETAKSHAEIRRQIFVGLASTWEAAKIPIAGLTAEHESEIIQSADLLDAYVAAVLAALWVINAPNVEIVGDLQRGSFLLPSGSGLLCAE
jgi:hypothetical protein